MRLNATFALLLISACAAGPTKRGPVFDNIEARLIPIEAERIEIELIDRRTPQGAPQKMLPGVDLPGGIRDTQPLLANDVKKWLESGLEPRLTKKPRVLLLQIEVLEGSARLEPDAFIEVVEARVAANLKLRDASGAVLAEGNNRSWGRLESKYADARELEPLFRATLADVIARFLDQHAAAINTSTTTTATTSTEL